VSPSARTLKHLATLEPIDNPDRLHELDRPGEYFDRDGEEINFVQWMMLWRSLEYKIVKQDTIGRLFVSTVWLGMDHGFGFHSRPIIFETMVFETMVFDHEEENARWRDIEQQRYCTEEEALAGHEEICDQVRLLEELR
jgi:hypothetical protein